MSRARVVWSAIALLCVPAGLVLLAVAVLHDNPPPDRPPPAFVTTTSSPTTQPGPWLLVPGDADQVSITPEGGAPVAVAVNGGGLAVDGDIVLGGTLELSLPASLLEALGAPGTDAVGHFVLDGAYDAVAMEVPVRGELEHAGTAWSVPGRGSFELVAAQDGSVTLAMAFEGTSEAGTDDGVTATPAFTIEIGVAFAPPS